MTPGQPQTLNTSPQGCQSRRSPVSPQDSYRLHHPALMTGHAWLIRVTHSWFFWASSLLPGLSFSQILPQGLISSYYNKSLTPNYTAVLLPQLIPDWHRTWARANVGPTDPERQCVDHGKVTPCVRQALGSSQPLQVASFAVSLAAMACPQAREKGK